MARNDRFEEQLKNRIEEEFNSNNTRSKILAACKRIEARLNNDIKRLIQTYMIDLYYSDYTPTHYHRTWQLNKTVDAWSSLEYSPKEIMFDFDYTRYEQNADGSVGEPLWLKMNHGTYKVTITYITKKGKQKNYQYTIKPPAGESQKIKAKREKRISDNLLKNVHGKPVFKGSHNIQKEIYDAIERLLDEKFDEYAFEELSKIL